MTNNPIAWAQFQLRGGLRASLTFCAIYATAVTGFYVFSHRADPFNFGRANGWLNLLLGIQSLSLLLFGTSRIGAGIRADVISRMIESHRLMPTPPAHAIAGYMVGGAGQALILFLTTFFIGGVISATAGLATDRWILSNAILLVFAAFVWSIVALMSFATTKNIMGLGWIVGMFVAVSASQGLITVFVPALTVLCSPIMGGSIFISTGGAAVPSFAYGASLIGQLSIGALYFFAAARRYCSADSSGFTPLSSVALLAVWVALSVFAMQYWKNVQPGMFRAMRMDETERLSFQTIFATASALLLALLPLAVSSRAYRRWQLHRAANDPALTRTPLHPLLAATLAAGLCVLIPALAQRFPLETQGADYLLKRVSPATAAMLMVTAMSLAFTFSCSFLFRVGHRGGGKRSVVVVGLFVVLTWLGPLGVEVVRNVLADDHREFIWTRVAGASPLGAMILTWGQGKADAAPGVILQLALAIFFVMLFYLTRPRKRVPPI
ncbi:hypothetical protein BH09PLA1_BH09PLA1_12200 [soil metagenome]